MALHVEETVKGRYLFGQVVMEVDIRITAIVTDMPHQSTPLRLVVRQNLARFHGIRRHAHLRSHQHTGINGVYLESESSIIIA